MERKITFDKVVRWVGTALLVIAVFLIVKYLSGALLPFFIAWFFAYLLYPVVKFVQYRLRVRVRVLAILLTFAFVVAVIGTIVWLIVPPMLEQFHLLGKFVSNYLAQQTSYNEGILRYVREYLQNNQESLEHLFKNPDFAAALRLALPKVFNIVGQTASVMMSVVASCIALLYLFFILLDYEYLANNYLSIFPRKVRPFWQEVMNDVERALNSYIRGQGLVALCMGTLFCMGFTIIDYPLAIGLGILNGILVLVPYLHTFALIPTAFLAMLKAVDTGQNFWLVFGAAVLVYVVVQVITDFVLVPKIMGKAMGLNPAVLLLALSVWGTLLGFIGLILALPLTTLIFAYWQRYVTNEEGGEDTKEGAE